MLDAQMRQAEAERAVHDAQIRQAEADRKTLDTCIREAEARRTVLDVHLREAETGRMALDARIQEAETDRASLFVRLRGVESAGRMKREPSPVVLNQRKGNRRRHGMLDESVKYERNTVTCLSYSEYISEQTTVRRCKIVISSVCQSTKLV